MSVRFNEANIRAAFVTINSRTRDMKVFMPLSYYPILEAVCRKKPISNTDISIRMWTTVSTKKEKLHFAMPLDLLPMLVDEITKHNRRLDVKLEKMREESSVPIVSVETPKKRPREKKEEKITAGPAKKLKREQK